MSAKTVSNGRSARIRAYLTNNPNARSLHVARAIGDNPREVNHELVRMWNAGVVTREGEARGKHTFTLVPNAPLRRRKSRATFSVGSVLPKLNPPTESLDEWIARGGLVEQCPSRIGNYGTGRARVSYTFQHEGRRRAF